MPSQAWKLHATNKLLDIVDPALNFNNLEEEEDVQRVIRIALLCTQAASTRRPSMNCIVSMLPRNTQSHTEVVLDGGEDESLQFDFSKWAQIANGSGLTPVLEEEESWLFSYGFSSDSQDILHKDNVALNNVNNIELIERKFG